jgi:hypothetical protein
MTVDRGNQFGNLRNVIGNAIAIGRDRHCSQHAVRSPRSSAAAVVNTQRGDVRRESKRGVRTCE